MVKRTPDWANGNRGEQRVPTRLRDYADFLVAAARHYPTVRHWMVWGEPTRGDAFKPMPANSPRGPRLYARMLDQAYGALKRVRRSNIVIGGMTWTVGVVSAPQFVRWMRLPNGRPPAPRLVRPQPVLRPLSEAEPPALRRRRPGLQRRRHAVPRGPPRVQGPQGAAPVAVGVHGLCAAQQPRLLLPRLRARPGALAQRRLPHRVQPSLHRRARLVHAARRAGPGGRPDERPARLHRQAQARVRAYRNAC